MKSPVSVQPVECCEGLDAFLIVAHKRLFFRVNSHMNFEAVGREKCFLTGTEPTLESVVAGVSLLVSSKISCKIFLMGFRLVPRTPIKS